MKINPRHLSSIILFVGLVGFYFLPRIAPEANPIWRYAVLIVAFFAMLFFRFRSRN